jgi:hypothetical protein
MIPRELRLPPNTSTPRRVGDRRAGLLRALDGQRGDHLRPVQRLPRHPGDLRGGASRDRDAGPSATASTRPGRSCTRRRPTGSRAPGRPSSTSPTPRCSSSTSTTSRCTCRRRASPSTGVSSTSVTGSCVGPRLGDARRQEGPGPLAAAGLPRVPPPRRDHLRGDRRRGRAGRDLLAAAQPRGRPGPGRAVRQRPDDPRRSRGFGHRVLNAVEHFEDAHRLITGYRTTNSRMTLGVGVDHVIETDNPWSASRTWSPDLGKVVFTIDARANVPIRITKFFTYHTSRSVPPAELIDRSMRALDRAARVRARSRAPSAPTSSTSGSGPTSRSTGRAASSRRSAGTSSSCARRPPGRRRPASRRRG